MRSITVLCVGKLKEAYLRDAAAEYQKRLAPFCRLSVIEVDEERLPDAPSDAQIQATLAAEGKRLLARVPAGAAVFALCIEGKEMSSPALAQALDRLAVDGCSHVVFIIGGSWGLSDEVKAAARVRLSMSPMTFPHQLARISLPASCCSSSCTAQGRSRRAENTTNDGCARSPQATVRFFL